MEDNKKQLKEAIKREYAKCATDPVYFLGKYGIIQHPVRGKVNFNLYDFQEKSLQSFMQHDYNICQNCLKVNYNNYSVSDIEQHLVLDVLE